MKLIEWQGLFRALAEGWVCEVTTQYNGLLMAKLSEGGIQFKTHLGNEGEWSLNFLPNYMTSWRLLEAPK